MWRGVLFLSPSNLVSGVDKDEVTTIVDNSNELPFNFEVIYDNENDFHIVIHNGSERIKVDEIKYGRDRTTAKDTLQIGFPIYDTHISAVTEERVMEGFWHVNYKYDYKVKFKAVYGDTVRFKKGLSKASINIDGRWDVKFEPGTEDEYPAIGIFNQDDDYLTGTFQTETGDYRFLEGKVADDKAFLSCFDGAHAFLFEAKDLGDGELNGIFKSGSHYTSPYLATKNNNAKIGDPFELNVITNPSEPMEIAFPNSNGDIITLNDQKYKGKPKIAMIMGTWCPNCKDASNFLKEFNSSTNENNIEIISIAFERYKDEAKNLAQIKRYKEKSNIPWEVVLGGVSSKSEASKAIPQIDKVISYPTMIFLDENNMIKGVHTGFSGPATSDYEDFIKKFNQITATL
jgi:thiol-disulfide isomerase/thioredoxin